MLTVGRPLARFVHHAWAPRDRGAFGSNPLANRCYSGQLGHVTRSALDSSRCNLAPGLGEAPNSHRKCNPCQTFVLQNSKINSVAKRGVAPGLLPAPPAHPAYPPRPPRPRRGGLHVQPRLLNLLHPGTSTWRPPRAASARQCFAPGPPARGQNIEELRLHVEASA